MNRTGNLNIPVVRIVVELDPDTIQHRNQVLQLGGIFPEDGFVAELAAIFLLVFHWELREDDGVVRGGLEQLSDVLRHAQDPGTPCRLCHPQRNVATTILDAGDGDLYLLCIDVLLRSSSKDLRHV